MPVFCSTHKASDAAYFLFARELVLCEAVDVEEGFLTNFFLSLMTRKWRALVGRGYLLVM